MNATILTTDQARNHLVMRYDFENVMGPDATVRDANELIESDPSTCMACKKPIAPWYDLCHTCAIGTMTDNPPEGCDHQHQTERGYCLDCGDAL